jgi:hypothetical protein
MDRKRDNSTFRDKVSLRFAALRELEEPRVLETHAGIGRIFNRCYADLAPGVAFEKDGGKAESLAVQRPTWAIYEGDSEACLRNGVGFHHEPNFFDLDPYGECWPTIDAIFLGMSKALSRIVLVVNDGLRQKLKMNGGWKTESLRNAVERFGNSRLYADYLMICRELVKEKAGSRGYRLSRWTGYYCGHAQQMTHFAAVLDRP